MANAVIYARYSSDMQRAESIDAQVRECRAWCDKSGHYVLRIYVDEAMSGTSDQRPDFQKMLQDAKILKDFQYVVVHKNDRFARNRHEDAFNKFELSKHGVKVIYATTPLDDSPESIILDSVLVGMAEYYSKNLARETMKGLKEDAYKAMFNGGRAPLGFSIVERQYQINEKEARWISYIFEQVAAGNSYTKIIEGLKKMGATTREGREFGPNSLNSILTNEKYIGVYVYNKVPKKVNGKRNNRVTKSEEEIIKIEGAIPAIISKELWDKVKNTMEQRRKSNGNGGKAKANYYLRGLVECGECGYGMTGDMSTSRTGEQKRYYKCTNQKKHKNCDNRTVGKDILENSVAQELMMLFNDTSRILQFAKSISEMLEVNQWESKAELNLLKKQLEAAEKEKNNLVMSIAKGIDPSIIKDALENANKKCEALTSQILNLENSISHPRFTEAQFIEYLSSMKEMDLDEIKTKFPEYVAKVIVTKEETKIKLLGDAFGVGADRFGVGDGTLDLSALLRKAI